MSIFRCHKCGYNAAKVGSCPTCKGPLEKCCPICHQEFDLCTCQSPRIQTKGQQRGKSRTGVQSR